MRTFPVKRAVWLGLLLPQLAYLCYLAFGQTQLLRMEWQYHTGEIFRNHPELRFDPAEFGLDALGVATILGLGALRRWARVVYTVGAMFFGGTFVFDLNDGPSPGRHSPLDCLLFGLVVTTTVLSYVRGLYFSRRVPAGGEK